VPQSDIIAISERIALRQLDGETMPEMHRIVYQDLVLAEGHLETILKEGAKSPAGQPWLCVLPTGENSFSATMEKAEDFAFDLGYQPGHFVIEFLLNE
jgi:hypothetical protein